jgi:hypothetical protein
LVGCLLESKRVTLRIAGAGVIPQGVTEPSSSSMGVLGYRCRVGTVSVRYDRKRC